MRAAEGVVHRLAGDGADLGPHDLVDVVGGAVRPVGHRPQHGQTLGRDLQAVLAEQRIVVDGCLPGHRGKPNPNPGLSLGLAISQIPAGRPAPAGPTMITMWGPGPSSSTATT